MTPPRSARPGRSDTSLLRRPTRTPIAARSGSSLRRRVRVIRAVILVGVAGLIVQLVNLQVLRAPHFEKLSAQQLLSTVTIPALRGAMYDRNGQLLALSVPTKVVVADDFQIAHPQVEALVLAPLLGVPAASLVPKLSEQGPGAGHVVLSANVSVAIAATLASDALPGITLSDSSTRTNPDGPLAESVLGSTFSDGAGSAGLEYEYQQLLAGQGGLERFFESPTGVSLPSAPPVILHRPVPGTGLELTLDAPLQYVAEQALGTELVDAHGVTGTAIVMDTRTGQILAMSSLVNTSEPDPSLISQRVWPTPTGIQGVYEAQNNLGVTSTYEPGSVFKIVPFSEGARRRGHHADEPVRGPRPRHDRRPRLPRRRAARSGAPDRDADPRVLVEHRHLRDLEPPRRGPAARRRPAARLRPADGRRAPGGVSRHPHHQALVLSHRRRRAADRPGRRGHAAAGARRVQHHRERRRRSSRHRSCARSSAPTAGSRRCPRRRSAAH